MVILVCIINTVISLILFYVAWRLWQLRRVLAGVANNLAVYERSTYAALHGAPAAISTGQRSIRNLRQRKEPLRLQVQRVRQVFSLLTIGANTWKRYGRRLRVRSLKKYK
jgi:hypothetical protein